ncbi:MAG: hypothetical protein U0637_01100 [Phycisphaerales bacterium]
MHRPGSNPESMAGSDFLCDFCGQTWADDRPMVEGHKGSLVCGKCLSLAYASVVVRNAGVVVPEHIACVMCLLNKSGDYWQSPLRVTMVGGAADIHPEPGACICRWCIEKSGAMLEKDPDSGWRRPQ